MASIKKLPLKKSTGAAATRQCELPVVVERTEAARKPKAAPANVFQAIKRTQLVGAQPPRHPSRPGTEAGSEPRPKFMAPHYWGNRKSHNIDALNIGDDLIIRVDAIAPGLVMKPLNPLDSSAPDSKKFGKKTAVKRPAHPEAVFRGYAFLVAPATASYTTCIVEPRSSGRPGS